ncbi:MAG: undecaprenyl-diphosphate phosphatase [Breznakibacter sp.]
MTIFEAIVLAIVEGLTEFLPISSTGHMIIAQKLLGMESTDFVKLFTVGIQLGAILSVVLLYWKKFLDPLTEHKAGEGVSFWKKFETKFRFYLKLFVAFIPSAIIGLLCKSYIDQMLESVLVVAISLVLGGIVLLFVDKWFKNNNDQQETSYSKALKIGFFQVISMIPGVSRSAATIIGGLSQKLSRKAAAEFSFFLAVPTMAAATGYELFQTYDKISSSDIPIFLTGNLVAFVVAMLAIKGFISYLTKHGFKVFGYYRIVVGLLIIVLLALGVDLNMAG